MYLKSLRIVEGNGKEIRNVPFKTGLNIIVDESNDERGNNVGKTTFLKIIDICLGSKDKKYIWTDNDTNSQTNQLKEYINSQKVFTELTFEKKKQIYTLKVELFDKGKRFINGKKYNLKDYHEALNEIIFNIEKPPSFRQLINKFVRIKQKMDNHTTLKFLNQNTTTREYRNIYDFLFKLDSHENSAIKLDISENIQKYEQDLKDLFRLHQINNLADLAERRRIVQHSVNDLQEKIETFINTSKYRRSLEEVSLFRSRLAVLNDAINAALFKRNKTEKILSKELDDSSEIDNEILKEFYLELKKDFSQISKDFNQLIEFNDKIKDNKISYYKKRVTEINYDISQIEQEREILISENKDIINLINENNYEEYDKIHRELIKQSEILGELNKVKQIYDTLIDQLESEKEQLEKIGNPLSTVNNLEVFNKYFTKFTQEVFGQRLYVYKNDDFPINLSNVDEGIGTGYRKTITLLLDIAYVSFIEELELDYPKFIVHDVLETIDEHNFKKIADFITINKTQFIFSILSEKIDDYSFIKEQDKILKLSKNNKLFKI
ncbi:hypothetical protein [Bacillus suaedae]|uniref:DUF2326 domain-containing protein n=1 Tax=Halalkalibacter suaedae TaxID=2822140 RepID=A0A940WU64_9BACI|nr:hypothetical protein [Bacillus suaedae]MBP3950298.1 hypothetical protein [Bacillus suaedae]